ncbi:hypothetical protein OAR23_02330, partial [bacterium]|nr:hypothetical protein [bacterium]
MIGLTDDDTYNTIEGTFVWMSGEPVVFTDWLTNEPNNTSVGEDFVIANQSNGQSGNQLYGWNDGYLINTTETEKGVYEFIPGAPQTITVDDTGAGDFLDIQSAINFADNGDTVIVKDGTYFEHINFNGKAITLKSENGAATTILDGSDTDRVVVFSSGEGSSSILRGFTVRNGHANYINSSMIGFGGGIFCKNSSSPTIEECV